MQRAAVFPRIGSGQSEDCRAVTTRGNNFTSPLSSLPPLLYLSTRAAPTGYLQDCLSLDAENDCHPPPLSFRHFFSPSPAKLNYDHWVLACVHICIHGYICIHFLYTHLYIHRRIHNPRIGCCASAVSFRLISPGPPCPWWSLVLYRLKITSLINHITATLSSSWLLKAGTAGKKKNIYRFLGSPVGMVRNPLYILGINCHSIQCELTFHTIGRVNEGNLKRVYVMPQDTTQHCGPQITVSSCGFHTHHTTNGPLACALISDFNMSPFRAAVLWAEPSIAMVFYFVFIATRWRIRPRNRFPASFQSSSNQTERSFPIFN